MSLNRIRIYKCPNCESNRFIEETEKMASVFRHWENGKIIKETCDFKKNKGKFIRITCKKCKKEFSSYVSLLPELKEDIFEKKLIDWLKKYFSNKLISDLIKNKENLIGGVNSETQQDDKNGETYLEVSFPYLYGYKERWLLSNNQKKISNRQLFAIDCENIFSNVSIRLILNKMKERNLWFFEAFQAEEYGCIREYKGYIDYDEKTDKFNFKSIVQTTITFVD